MVDAPESQKDEKDEQRAAAAALLAECSGADLRHWADLHRNEEQIEFIYSGEVQRSASSSYTSAHGARGAQNAPPPPAAGRSPTRPNPHSAPPRHDGVQECEGEGAPLRSVMPKAGPKGGCR